jgi:two-component system NtrC family sensor kinase
MSLQFKISALLLAVFMVFGVFIYAVQQLVILPSFVVLEREDARDDIERVVQAVQREVTALAQQAGDWSSWDDSYRYLEDGNSEFRESNLSKLGVFELLRVDLLYFIDVSGNVVWSVVYDRKTGEAIKLEELSDTFLSPDHPLTAQASQKRKHAGLMSTSRGPMLIVAKPSLDSSGNGPSHGTLLFGRFLDERTLARIAKQARVKLAVWPLQGEELGAEQAAMATRLGSSGENAIRADDNENRVYRVMQDIFGKPAILLRVTAPKLIAAHGREANHNARIALASAALLILLALLVGLRLIVLKPIAHLIAHADEVGRRDDLSIRLDTSRRDELGELAREFNQMIERLAEARKTLQEQSRKAGIAELASGVLHNIGNAITPLKVRVANLESALRAAPIAELNMALAELDDAGIPSERRGDLREFLDLGVRELTSLVKTTIEQIVGVAHQVEHVQKILSDQESISRAARVLQPVEVAELVGDSVELLGTEIPRTLRIDLDASLRSVGRVLGSPVALQQIMINLLKNAAESIRLHSTGAHNGRIELTAAAENRDGRDVIRLSINDNGAGISPEHLSRLFQRGFSTKSRPSSGQGLHWCAITAAALGGKITIDSAGAGQGATVSLWLPKA